MTETTRTDPNPKKNLTIEDLRKAKKILENYSNDDTFAWQQPADSILMRCGDRPDAFVNFDAVKADMTVNRLTALTAPRIRCHPTDHDHCLAMVRSWELEGIPIRIQANGLIPEGKAWIDTGPDDAVILDLASGEGFHFKKPKFRIEEGKIRFQL